ncbi:MAG: NHLP family bacteriocin export ABC transporter peptidase/permease/ATPase subunit [Pegethrix bostrychoides GSE-TBD4-15B]|jgi:ATP-binding cassette subfamily C protein|uniref:NHLP family bacteriocin export ABC transporter peptidase/permease/ATPase subunit n=1 Tax=Pegethrix bostrychoides GSE-TBD4-15B TaxID=2839662 RepID=A0A951PFC7_9CYAN|nr:NHLP family bacteriocin export ABC transporter peptidase/permease/ATPase subunit [Pegethrix bostrychoides GSE-TBD4-15B]
MNILTERWWGLGRSAPQSAPKAPSEKSPSETRAKAIRVRTPVLLQIEAVECGAAALGIILGYYGRIVPLAELRQACGVSREGSSAANIILAAQNYGMIAKGYKKTLERLLELPPPYIVFWRFEHFLVVEGFNADYSLVYLNDPASGRRSIAMEEFDQSYTGVVLKIEPGEQFQRGGRKKSVVGSLRLRLRQSYPALIYCIAAGFLLVIPNLALPIFSQLFVDQVLVRQQLGWFPGLLLAILLAVGLQGLLTAWQLQALRKLRMKLSVSLASQFVWHVLRLPAGFYAQRFPGEISSRVSLNDQVAEVLSGEVTTTIISAVLVGFYALLMLQYSPLLTGIVVCFALLNVAVLQWVAQRRIDVNSRISRDFGKVDGVAIAGLQSIETLKASGLESDFFARWAGFYTKATNARSELALVSQRIGVLPSLLSTLSMVALLGVGGWQILQGQMTIGMLLAFQLLTRSFLTPINNLVKFGKTLQDLSGNLTRLDDVLDNAADPTLTPKLAAGAPTSAEPQLSFTGQGFTGQSFTGHRLQGYVELERISFGYSRGSAPLIQDFSLSIRPGQRVALIGGSGSGKSTIARIVSGLYEPWQGEVRLDGVARAQIPRSVLTDSIAVVDQDILLFADTIRHNLTLWDATVAESALQKACEDAAIHEVVLSIPGGYSAELSEGAANLSGGQRQRLEIARALVNQPSILIMDEATSALDSETEKIIDQNLRRRGCTCLIVAHRLSTIRDCDEIIVLERGKVVQRGTHETLWEADGPYTHLISSEAG